MQRATRRVFARFEAYPRAILVLAAQLPIIGVLLMADVRAVVHSPSSLLYVVFVLLGYYGLIGLGLVTLAFAVTLFARRPAIVVSGLVMGLMLYYFFVDTPIYAIFKFHLDAFWIAHIFVDYDTMGVPLRALLATIALFAVALATQWILFRIVGRVRKPGPAALGFVIAAILSFMIGEAAHIVAYERDQAEIIALTPRLPLYYPITWHREAVKYGSLVAWALGPAQSGDGRDALAFHYPLHRLQDGARRGPLPNVVVLMLESWRYDAIGPEVTPNLERLAQRGSVFERHFSSGNSTPTGVFGLFYGIHPTYWDAITAQRAQVGNPLLVQLLAARHYAIGIYAEHFERHKIAATLFHGIAVHDTFVTGSPDERDADMTRQMGSFIADAVRRHQHFFSYEFFKSTHYSYYYPPASARFEPSEKLPVGMAGDRSHIPAYLNDYRNSVHYVDQLMGRVFSELDSLGVMDSTIVVVTGDHSEEFDDDGAGYWGHASNFTQYQTHVPMVMFVPGRAPRRVSEVTTHVDIATTLIQMISGTRQDPRDYSDGLNLWGRLPAQRPLVISSYVNHAFIFGDNVYSVFPMYVDSYKLNDARAHAGRLQADATRVVREEMTRFGG